MGLHNIQSINSIIKSVSMGWNEFSCQSVWICPTLVALVLTLAKKARDFGGRKE